jgi:hypothetical protein
MILLSEINFSFPRKTEKQLATLQRSIAPDRSLIFFFNNMQGRITAHAAFLLCGWPDPSA